MFPCTGRPGHTPGLQRTYHHSHHTGSSDRSAHWGPCRPAAEAGSGCSRQSRMQISNTCVHSIRCRSPPCSQRTHRCTSRTRGTRQTALTDSGRAHLTADAWTHMPTTAARRVQMMHECHALRVHVLHPVYASCVNWMGHPLAEVRRRWESQMVGLTLHSCIFLI